MKLYRHGFGVSDASASKWFHDVKDAVSDLQSKYPNRTNWSWRVIVCRDTETGETTIVSDSPRASNHRASPSI